MTRYLTLDELVYINDVLPGNDKIHKILQGKQKVRDIGLLEAAAARPMQSVFGEDAYPTLHEKAAVLLHSIARNHPFADGNKRTATVAAIFMLQVNGLRIQWNPAEALERVVALAEGDEDPANFAAWLRTEPGAVVLEQDAEADMGAIAKIFEQHHWLLEELAKR